MRRIACLLSFLCLAAVWGPLQAAPVRVDAGIPGGNIIVDSIEGNTIRVHQDLRDTQGDWFYWAFRVRGAAGKKLTAEFTKTNVIGVRGPAVSTDRGRTWSWLGAQAVKGRTFEYQVPAGLGEVRFSCNIPYFATDLQAFLKRHRGNPALQTGVLATSSKGRKIEQLRAGRLDGNPPLRVLLTARHHACESMASYSMEGILETVLGATEDGRWFRENVEFFAVPFMDKDGVEDGDQGKNRRPRDHNRDYAGESIYASVRSLREFIPRWSEERLKFALDMHCPGLRGKVNEEVMFVGGRDEMIWHRVLEFSRILEKVQSGPLVFSAANNLPYGTSWNTGANTGDLKSNSQWSSELPGILIGSSIEIPYATSGAQAVTAESARALGVDLARALRVYLQQTK